MSKLSIKWQDSHPQNAEIQTIVDHWHNSFITQFEFETSGSTGPAQKIIHSRPAIEASVHRSRSALDWNNESFFCPLPVSKTGGKMMVFRSLILNMPLVCVEPIIDPFTKIAEEHDFTSTSLTPQQVLAALSNKSSLEKLKRFKTVLIGGAPFSHSLNLELAKQSWTSRQFWYHTFGMTETLSHVALCKISGGMEDFFSVLPGVHWDVAPNGTLKVWDGYFKAETRDLIEPLDANRFRWIGRMDDVINSGGVKIALNVLEKQVDEVLDGMGFRRDFALVPEVDAVWGQRIVLVMTGVPIKDAVFVLEVLKRELPKFHGPQRIVFVESIPRNASGKLDRSRLSELI